MDRRECLTALASGAALMPAPVLAAPGLTDDERWVRQQRRVLRRLRSRRGDPELRRALTAEGLPPSLASEALAAMVLGQGFSELSRERRRAPAVQDFLWQEAPRIGTAMATWVSWLDGLDADRRQALDDHLAESPETLTLAGRFVSESAAVASLDLDLERQLKRAHRALRRRSLRWGLAAVLRSATADAQAEGLGDDRWRGGRFRQDPAGAAPRGGAPGSPPRGGRARPLPPIVAWGLRMLGIGLVFVAAGWVLGVVASPVAGGLLIAVGLVLLLVGLFALFWGAIAVGLGLHLPPRQRRQRRPPPRAPRR